MRRLGRDGSSPDDIEDGEFVEITDERTRSAPPPTAPTLENWWQHQGFFVKALIALVPLFMLAMCMAAVSEPVPDGSEVQSAPVSNVEPADGAEAETVTAPSATVSPALEELVLADDPAACSHESIIQAIRTEALTWPGSLAMPLDRSDVERLEAMAQADVELITATDVRADLHQISCAANLRYGAAKSEAFRFTYQIQPSATAGEGRVYQIAFPPSGKALIFDKPMMRFFAELQRNSAAADAPTAAETSPAADPPIPTASSSATDDDIYAPHP